MFVKTAIIILFHGSRADGAAEAVRRIINEVRNRGCYDVVEAAFLQHTSPAFATAVQSCVQLGTSKIVVVPFFLQMGLHVTADVPVLIDRAREHYPDVQISMTHAVGAHPGMIDIVLDLAGNA